MSKKTGLLRRAVHLLLMVGLVLGACTPPPNQATSPLPAAPSATEDVIWLADSPTDSVPAPRPAPRPLQSTVQIGTADFQLLGQDQADILRPTPSSLPYRFPLSASGYDLKGQITWRYKTEVKTWSFDNRTSGAPQIMETMMLQIGASAPDGPLVRRAAFSEIPLSSLPRFDGSVLTAPIVGTGYNNRCNNGKNFIQLGDAFFPMADGMLKAYATGRDYVFEMSNLTSTLANVYVATSNGTCYSHLNPDYAMLEGNLTLRLLDVIPDLQLTLRSDADRFSAEGTQLHIEPSNPDLSWSLSVKPGPGIAAPPANCPLPGGSSGSGNKSLAFTGNLPNGSYTVSAGYNNYPQPENQASLNLEVAHPIDLSVAPASFDRGEGSASFKVEAPPCTPWTLAIAESPQGQCQIATGSTSAEGIAWNGVCNGELLPVGTYSAQLQGDGINKSVNVSINAVTSPGPTAPPTDNPPSPGPTATPTPGPSDSPAPTPSPDPTPTPGPTPSPGPTSTPGPTPTPVLTPDPHRTPQPKPTPIKRYRDGGVCEGEQLASPANLSRASATLNALIQRLSPQYANLFNNANSFGISSLNQISPQQAEAYFRILDDLAYMNEETQLLQAMLQEKGVVAQEPPFLTDYSQLIQSLDWQFGNSPHAPALNERVQILFQESVVYQRLMQQAANHSLLTGQPDSQHQRLLQQLRHQLHKHSTLIQTRAEDWAGLSAAQTAELDREVGRALAILDDVQAALSVNRGFSVQAAPPDTSEIEAIRVALNNTLNSSPQTKLAALQAARDLALGTTGVYARTPVIITPTGAVVLIGLAAVTGILVVSAYQLEQKICQSETERKYGSFSLQDLQLQYGRAAGKASTLLRATQECDLTQARAPEQVTAIAAQIHNWFGSNTNTNSLSGKMNTLIRTVKRDSDGHQTAAITESMASLHAELTRIENNMAGFQAQLEAACKGDCISKARNAYNANGRTTPINIVPIADQPCYIYRAGQDSPPNLTPSIEDLAGGLSFSPTVVLARTSNPNQFSKFGALEVSVQGLNAGGLLAWFDKDGAGRDHVSVKPGSGSMQVWGYITPTLKAEFSAWINALPKPLPVATVPQLPGRPNPGYATWIQNLSRKKALEDWFVSVKRTGNPPVDLNPSSDWRHVAWRNNIAAYPMLYKLIHAHTWTLEKSIQRKEVKN